MYKTNLCATSTKNGPTNFSAGEQVRWAIGNHKSKPLQPLPQVRRIRMGSFFFRVAFKGPLGYASGRAMTRYDAEVCSVKASSDQAEKSNGTMGPQK